MKTRLATLLTSVIVLSSCAGMTQVTVPQSNINIYGKDVVTGPRVTYTLKKTYFFGIGGLSKKARTTNVVDELFKKVDLQRNETLAYITQSKSFNTYLGIVTFVELKASGYVVKVVDDGVKEPVKIQKVPEEPVKLTARQYTLKRVNEINDLLADGGDANVIKTELNDIEAWYKENGYYTNSERSGVKKAKALINQRESQHKVAAVPEVKGMKNEKDVNERSVKDAKIKQKQPKVEDVYTGKTEVGYTYTGELAQIHTAMKEATDVNVVERLVKRLDKLIDAGVVNYRDAKPLYKELFQKIKSLD